MNEININIEGYNVNGICVGCLNYNRKMFYNDEVKECFKLLANIDVPDGLTIQVCWECLASVRAIRDFQMKILHSYEELIAYSREHTFLNSPSDLSKHATERLTVSRTNILSYEEGGEVPMLLPEINGVKMETDQIKIENDGIENDDPTEILKEESDYENSTDFFEPLPKDESSDEDIQLSELKRGKEIETRKGKKEKGRKKVRTRSQETKKVSTNNIKDSKSLKQKSSRKLKNLPEDTVELYTMTEKEMWNIRNDDVSRKMFVKLKYKCDKCIISFNTEKLMNEHMQRKHQPKSESSYQCDVCQAFFLTTDNVSTHRSLHLTAYRCKECQYTTGLKRVMAKHVQEHEKETHTCKLCDKTFNTKSKLLYHKSVCRQEKPQCDCCGKVFANKVTLKYHLKIITKDKTESKPKEKLYLPCKGCSKVFYTKKSYRAHVVIHEGLEYPCPVCGKLFQWKRNLARHLRNHAERDAGTRHECRQCGKKFSSRDCFNNHMRFSKRHVSEEALPHECEYCGKKFPTKWCMVDHIDWDHLKKIKYQCFVCFKPFKTAKIMVAHVNNIHEGKKNKGEADGEHLCDICGKSYKTVKRLKGHVWAMHTTRSNGKSFKCRLCPATFTWQTSIYKHIKCMHGNTKRQNTQLQALAPAPEVPLKTEPYSVTKVERISYYPQNIIVPVVGANVPPNGFPIG